MMNVIDGIEYDFEWHYQFLDKIGIIFKILICIRFSWGCEISHTKPVISADIGVWGCCEPTDSYPLGVLPWVKCY